MSAECLRQSAQKGHADVVDRVSKLLARVNAWFFSDAMSAALAWLAVIVLCACVLAWFFAVSPYGAPAAPVYAEF